MWVCAGEDVAAIPDEHEGPQVLVEVEVEVRQNPLRLVGQPHGAAAKALRLSSSTYASTAV